MKMKYGADVELVLGVRLAEEHSDKAIKFDTNRGIVFGDSSLNDMKTYLQFYCSNSTTPQELALELEMSLELVAAASMEDFFITLQITNQSISDTKVLTDNVGMFYHDYDLLFTSVISAMVYDFNTSHVDGIDLKKKSIIKFVSNLIPDTIITPFQENTFIYAGFRWITDQ